MHRIDRFKNFFAAIIVSISLFSFSDVCLAQNDVSINIDDDEDPKTSLFEFGFYSPLQLCGENTTINGMRISGIYTYNKAVNGLDTGIICQSDGVSGLQFAGYNKSFGVMEGLSVALSNVARGEVTGAQLSIIYNQAGSDSEDWAKTKTAVSSGFQAAWVNSADSFFAGLQLGMLNVSSVLLKGFQIGLINVAKQPEKTYHKFQTKEFKENKDRHNCIQIGLINFNSKGFLPVTLLINF